MLKRVSTLSLVVAAPILVGMLSLGIPKLAFVLALFLFGPNQQSSLLLAAIIGAIVFFATSNVLLTL